MAWSVYLARFFAGAFLVNAVPHFVSGVQGRRFPSPFASPPGKGESSPMVNVLWGTANAVVGRGGFLFALMLSRAFGQVYGSTPTTHR